MTTASTFDSTKDALLGILDGVNSGKVQLPDFQRGWVWDDEHIKSLLASVGRSFPIGAVMTLETGGSDVQFKPRPLEGTTRDIESVTPETLILDGQQRLTSLFQAIRGNAPVKTHDTRKKVIERWYYFDMRRALDSDVELEEAILSVPEDKKVKGAGGRVALDLSSQALEFEHRMFPANLMSDYVEWRQDFSEHWDYDRDEMRLFNRFEREIIKRFEQYLVPVIKLAKDTPKEAVCLVFEKVNTGGVTLTVFELLTASFAADGFQLRDDWHERELSLKVAFPVLKSLPSDYFLQATALLTTQALRRAAMQRQDTNLPGIGCRRREILRLTVEDYIRWADKVEDGFRKTAQFLHEQKIFQAKDIPYQTQLVPLTAILVDLGSQAASDSTRQKIARWFWCGVLGELYGGAVETRFARDLPEVVEWVRGESDEPSSVSEAVFDPGRLVTLRTRNSAAYKGIHALLMRDGCQDFKSGVPIESQAFFDESIDIHHIFPEKWCNDNAIAKDYYNSAINKTALSATTNRIIGGLAPSDYLTQLEQEFGTPLQRMDDLLRSHRIEPSRLRADDFWGFYEDRAASLLFRIGDVMGKRITYESGIFTADAPVEDYDDGPIDWDEVLSSAVQEVAD